MRKFNILFTSIFVSFGLFAGAAFAERNPLSSNGGQNNSGSNLNIPSLAAGCVAATASRDLDLNNVRALIHTGGDMWWDLVNTAKYEIPKGSGKHSMFAGALWMGGVDVNGQLKLAAQRFRGNGNDYWPGPLNTETFDIDAETCRKYDKHFVTTRNEVQMFKDWHDLNQTDPAQAAIDFPGYTIPQSIIDWPGNGDPSKKEGQFLAPFYDADNDGFYDPYSGDYPGYELDTESDCRTTRDVHLYGDKNLWWVFNDKGNVHTETGGAPIGMEVRAQAFAFATNDEVNNMTFYNYELINRSTFTLANTYFGVWADSDLGFAQDDFVGCDVQRGLGYSYNGKQVDGTGGPANYTGTPPAIGIDFFEGPYQDNDSIDNPLAINDYNAAKAGNGIPYPGLGIGYGDGIVDNERFGMSRFLYHNNTGEGIPDTQDPTTASDYYNFLRGMWKSGLKMNYGGNGHNGGSGGVDCNYMFPGNTDPIGWGTGGVPQLEWTEETVGNVPYDRRFAQSAGPFVLKPGAVNNITVGVVWAKALSGGPFASVEKLRLVDDKAQALFDNCFRILNGPDAPDVAIKELDRELILHLSNKRGNNINETYEEVDYTIPPIEVVNGDTIQYDTKYRFQGYLIYQVKDATVTADELGNPDRARITAQVDVKDGVTKLVNYKFDENLNANVPEDVIIEGEDKGVYHSFRILEDKFAINDKFLVNHKSYYFLAVAYGYNNYKEYNMLLPDLLDGQRKPYKLSRKGASGSIRAYKGVPHNSAPRNGGTYINSSYGDQPMITRVEGQGNGGLNISFTTESEAQIFSAGRIEFPEYKKGFGPVDIKVVDPISVPDATFQLKVNAPGTSSLDTATWTLTNTSELILDGVVYQAGEYSVNSETTIKIGNEQIIPAIGFSIRMEQNNNPGVTSSTTNGFISAALEFTDNQKNWLIGVPDEEIYSPFNWIRSGSYVDTDSAGRFSDIAGKDPKENYERVLGGTWTPYGMASFREHGPGYSSTATSLALLNTVKSVDVVITNDQSKWTRCPVIENQFNKLLAVGGAEKGKVRNSPSVGKDGKPDGDGNGMGWFPGYAVCLETGERLNMAFAEDSWLADANGRDMLWNPTNAIRSSTGDLRGGGKHFIYVFNNIELIPSYDEGKKLRELITSTSPTAAADMRNAWKTCMWVGYPLVNGGQKLFDTDVRVQLRVSRKYGKYQTSSEVNGNNPLYTFSMKDYAALKGEGLTLDSALSLVNVVPNPYYAYSAYEANQLDNRIKVINLPEIANVTIYTVNGTLVRKITKSDPSTSLEWDLKNHAGIPVAGGVYLIHVSSTDDNGVLRERVLKWFGIMRPVDLDSF
ncbi:MAG: T9SS type A sorting domain-containing protein [Bacteroidota bacterium]|nr:T9SS type A sorting domain-containing protein [Bacteroidota bacterium]